MSQKYDGKEEQNITTAKKYCIRSKNVWIQEKSDFLDAYIFVDGEITAEVLCTNQQQRQIEELLKTFPLHQDYGDLYIFPGLIDLNVSLHIGTDWEEIEQTTELYLKGGVTTIACQPLLTNEIYLKDELVSIRNRKQRILNKSNTDYCFFANLYPENISELEHIYQEPGVAGFKIYLTSPFQNGAGWVETKRDMDFVLNKLNQFRQKLETQDISPTLIENQCQKQFQCNHKNLLVTFHSIKSGEKELTITSPLRQRKIEERCDRTTQIKRTQGDSILGETQKGKKKQEINYEDDQFDSLTMGQISECINDNILNFQNQVQNSDEELSAQDLHPENNKSLYENPFKENENNQANLNGDQPHYSSHSNREKLIKMYGKASINSTENLQIQLLSRAERKTYNNQDESDEDDEEYLSSDSKLSEEQEQSSSGKDDSSSQNGNNNLKIHQLDETCSPTQENQAKLEKSTSFCSPISSPSSQRYDTMSPKSELCQKESRKESHESSDEIKFQDQIPFPAQNQNTYSYDIEPTNNIDSIKNTCKVIKMQKVQQDDCNISYHKDEDKAGSLHQIDENAESARDSNSENEHENSFNQNQTYKQVHKKSYNDYSERSGSGCSSYILAYKTKSLINSKRSSHDITYINQNQNSEGPQIKLIRDMKRGSCEKDSHTFINDNTHTLKKSNFRAYNNEVQSMVEINKSENSSPSLNARSSKLFEKRKSRTLTVQIDLKLNQDNNNLGKSQNNNEDESDQNMHEHIICLKSSGQIGDDQTSCQSFRDNNNHEFGGFLTQQNNRYNIPHCNSSIFLAKIHQEKEDWNENQIFNNGFKEEYSTRKQSSDSGSNHSIGNHLLNQSVSSLTGTNFNSQTIVLKQNNDNSKLCECYNQNCKCLHNNQIQKSSKFNQDYLTFLAFRPPYWEYFGIQLIRDSLEKNLISSKVKLNVVFANIGNSNSMYRITVLKQDLEKKNKNIHLFSETTGAYLFFSSNNIHNGSTIFKCEPPIGGKENKEFLINASKLNMVDTVSSYHFPVEYKFKCIEDGDFRKAFSGICTAGFTLQATWTALYQSYKNIRNKSLSKNKDEEGELKKLKALLNYLVNMLSAKPAKILSIHNMKGSIQKGKYADFVIWDPFSDCQRIKIPPSYRFKSVHIFDKRKVYGHVQATILRGNIVYDNQNSSSQIFLKSQGKLITKCGVK
ncbi:amidohydrolase family protein (macronuclear) [Tetrahymena thermophila SB210]|uniref:Amidohydrolase family protein n=1 Tax=Tetrahymena thermophila (strain SB210) TaxID=312017 RepID=I7MI88_TETTS|nr:amidohydrolase family protein [Tetrahymena thermophila SB210]EAR90994.3 amidohydrolase family protein [Tetrahymena thermophila SB210]|eukprot:XP_001011239.3 amidohydrolase family protein [Tetrahymena thermophila SB210]